MIPIASHREITMLISLIIKSSVPHPTSMLILHLQAPRFLKTIAQISMKSLHSILSQTRHIQNRGHHRTAHFHFRSIATKILSQMM